MHRRTSAWKTHFFTCRGRESLATTWSMVPSQIGITLFLVMFVSLAGCDRSGRVAKNGVSNGSGDEPPTKEQVQEDSAKADEANSSMAKPSAGESSPGESLAGQPAADERESHANSEDPSADDDDPEMKASEVSSDEKNTEDTSDSSNRKAATNSKMMPERELEGELAEAIHGQPDMKVAMNPKSQPVDASSDVLIDDGSTGDEKLPPSDKHLADDQVPPSDGAGDGVENQLAADSEDIHNRFRTLLPTTAGVLIVDFDIRVGEFDLTAMHADRIQQVMADAAGKNDKDETKELTWRSLFQHVRDDPQNFGRNMVQPNQYKDMTRRYDSNLNKRPDRDETAKFLFRSAGFGGPFRLKGTHHYRQINRSRSEIFQTLDRDNDRVLSPDELSQVSQMLLRLDQNGDQRIDLSETASPERDDESAWKRRNSNRLGEVAMDLEGYIDWSMVSYSLGGFALHSPFGIDDGAISQIDSDGNGEISKSEAEKLRDVEADLELIVRFADEVASKPTFEVARCAAELDSMIALAPGARAVSVTGQSLRMIFRADDAEGGEERVPPEVFAMLDANADGGIDEDEFPDVGNDEFSFESLDANDDGKVTLSEINGRGRRPTAIWNAQVRARGAESPDALFSWLDWNQDGFLSEREIAAAPRRLSGDPNESIAAIDLPDAFVVHLIRGDPSQDERNFEPPSAPLRPSITIPRWAVEMDSNRDGEISRMEFIGTADQFASLDQNADGFITVSELPKSRKHQ